MGRHLTGHTDEDWAYGTRRVCARCCGDAIYWGTLGLAVVTAEYPDQRAALARVLEYGYAVDHFAWWCRACGGCGLAGVPGTL